MAVTNSPFAGGFFNFTNPIDRPLSAAGKPQPNAYRYFYATGGSIFDPRPVYADAELKAVLNQPIYADNSGAFPPIYLHPAIQYGAALYDPNGVLIETTDPVNLANMPIPGGLYGVNPGGPITAYAAIGVPTYVYKSDNRSLANIAASGFSLIDPELSIVLPATGSLSPTYWQVEADISLICSVAPVSAYVSLVFTNTNAGLGSGIVNGATVLGIGKVIAPNAAAASFTSTPVLVSGPTPIKLVGFVTIVPSLPGPSSPGVIGVEMFQVASSNNPITIQAGSSLRVMLAA